ncbi:MAG: Tol-Pal system protein TolB [Magnetococcales bacterium]|nr:Tol-Pal system protein TolB [Magnetococcales bacterium]
MASTTLACPVRLAGGVSARPGWVWCRWLVLLVGVFGLGLSSAWAGGIRIDITKGGLTPLPIAVPSFVNLGADGQIVASGTMGGQLSEVVTADLERSGLFRPINRSAFLQMPDTLWRTGPQYKEWRVIGAEAVVSGATRQEGDQVIVDFFLYDVFQGTLIGKGKRFTASSRNWRHVAHRVADEIYTRLTGETGYFTSRIAFVAQKGGSKLLAMMDQDGANRVDLTHGENLVLTPRFSPDGDNLFYISYETGGTRIFRLDLIGGGHTLQGDYPGLNSAPSWSPDGRRMALTLSKDGNPEIYSKELGSGQLSRLTNTTSINTSPSWSPDGQKIVFNSDRAGSPQLYIMSSGGGEPQRITFDGKYNSSPSWSPRGDLIAFVHGGGGRFRIAVISPDGKNMRVLTDSWMDESPTWSPNGRVILFSRQEGSRSQLYSIDLTGYNERLVPVGGDSGGSDPSWSPLIR